MPDLAMRLTRESFEDLVRAHHAAVFRTAARLLPAADAEDVTQQVFTRVWQGKHRVGAEPGASLRWLAGRLALNALREERTQRRHQENHAMRRDPSSHTPDPAAAEACAAVRSALAELPPDLRAAVVLRYQDGLGFDGIAAALACAQSTAHERVQRGLERLRALLTRAGFAAVAARVTQTLADADAQTAPPPTLEPQLLAVPGLAGAGAASAWPAALLLVLALGATAVAWWTADFASRQAALGLASAVAPVAAAPTVGSASESAAAAPRAPVLAPHQQGGSHRLAEEPTGRIFGRVLDASDGSGLATAKVTARSLARGRKGEDFRVDARADASGYFELRVPVGERRREAYSIWVQRDDYVQFGPLEEIVAADASVEVRAELRRWATDRIGEWQLELSLLDADGAPLPQADVTVHRRQPDVPREQQRVECRGTTDAAGRVTLRGTHRGEKTIHVPAPRGSELAARSHSLAIAAAGPHALTLALPRGRAIAGTLLAVTDRTPVVGLMVTATQGDEQVGFAASDANGRFRIAGCGEGSVRLRGHAPGWSVFVAEGFAPGEEQLELLLKRRDDATARGLHLGELHGRVRDAADDAPLAVSIWDVDVEVAPVGENWRNELLDDVLHPRPVQRSVAGPVAPPAATFVYADLPRGRYALVVRKRGYATALLGPYEVGPGLLVRDIDVALTPGATVTAVVRDAQGQPVSKACVWLTTAADPSQQARDVARQLSGGDRYPTYRYEQTDGAGRLTLQHVPAGATLRCVAADPAGRTAQSAPFVPRDGSSHDVELRLSR